MTNQETRMPFDRLLCARVGIVLLEIALGRITPRLISHGSIDEPHTCWEDTWNADPTFQCRDWHLRIFNDCGDWDYVDGGRTPEGEVFCYEAVNQHLVTPDICEVQEPEDLLSNIEQDAMETAFKKARRD